METILRLFELTLMSSLEAALMVGLIFLIVTAFRRKLTALWQYALWTLLIVKLMLPWIPVNLGFDFHWIRLPERMVSNEYITMQDRLDSPIGLAGQLTSWADLEGWNGVTVIPSDASRYSFSIMEIAAVVWLLGVLTVVTCTMIGNMRMSIALRRENRTTVPSDLQHLFVLIRESIGIRSRVRLRLSSRVTSPSLFGLFSPVVLIPRNMAEQLGAAEWECVFRHELVHFKRKDIWVNTLFTLLAAVHWFNPAIWYGLNRLRFEQEAACDASVLTSLRTKDAYARSIVKVLEIGASRRTAPTGIGFSDYKNQIKRRMLMIRNFKPSKKRAALLGIIVLSIVGLLALPSTFAQSGTSETPSAKISSSEAAVQPAGEQNDSDLPPIGAIEDVRFQMPTSGKLTSVFGYRTHPVSKQKSLHDGVDIANQEGTEVSASAGGKIIRAEYDSAHGFIVVIEHNDSWQTEYRHFKELSVDQGEMVDAGDRIGLMGQTGEATGPHLHFSIKKDGRYVDPEPLLHAGQSPI